MEKFLRDLGAVLLMAAMIFSIAYMLVYAWDLEADLQEKKEAEYKYERELK